MEQQRTDGVTEGTRSLEARVARIGGAALSRRRLLRGGGLVIGAAALSPILAACGGKNAVTSSAATSPASAAASAAAAAPAAPTVAAPTVAAPAAPAKSDTYLTVLTGDMLGKADWPAFVPADFSVPANALVTVHVACFDDEDPMTDANLVQYTKVAGTVNNTVTVQPFSSDSDPNKMGAAQTLSAFDPAKGVSHTITISQLGINVPVAGHGWTTFTLQTGAPGKYAWECKVPCGSGANGQGGAMATEGYMQGTMTVTA